MKTFAILLTLLLAGSAMAQEAEAPGAHLFIGGEYDNTDGWGSTFGAAKKISGDLWTIGRAKVGMEAAALEANLVYFVKAQNWRLGLVGGPAVDWVGGESPVTYFVGASGFIGGYISDRTGFGVMAGAKYKFALKDDTFYRDGWQGGLWLTYGL